MPRKQLMGVDGRSLHGLKKAYSRSAAERGDTVHEIKAVTGHKTLREVERYTAAADQQKLADHHAVMVAAMKTKQTVDPAAVKKLRAAVENLRKHWR